MKRALVWGILISLFAFPVRIMAAEVAVKVGHGRLEPAEVAIAAGDTVNFHNQDRMPGGHKLVADDGSFESPALGKDESWSHIFAKPGTYSYRIKEHPEAKGRVVVK